MLNFRKRLKFNKVLSNIIKLFIICFFGLAIFDKANINILKDIIVKVDAEYIYSLSTRLIIAFKTITFDLPMIISFVIYIINFICLINCLIILSLLFYKLVIFITNLLISNSIKYSRHNDNSLVTSIYLVNGKFRC